MVRALRKAINGHGKVVMFVGAPLITWGTYVTVTAVSLASWKDGHETWASTTYASVLTKIDENSQAAKDDRTAIRTSVETSREDLHRRFDDKMSFDSSLWERQFKWNERQEEYNQRLLDAILRVERSVQSLGEKIPGKVE